MCSSESALPTGEFSCCRMPWMIRLEDFMVPDNQLRAAYQNTKLDHEIQLNINSNPRLVRLTRIMVTLGRMNSHPDGVVKIVEAGADVVRLNMSHENDKWHAITVQSVREAGNRLYRATSGVNPISVVMDLQGPEIRAGIFHGNEVCMGYAKLEKGNMVRLLTDDRTRRAGTASCFWVSYPNLPRVSRVGDRILIDRGAVILEVTCIGECSVICKVMKGGTLRDQKLVQLMDTAIDLPQVSQQDDSHIKLGLNLECDFIIVNHAMNSKMVSAVKEQIKKIGTNGCRVLAKISTQQGLRYFDEILQVADGIVFDRTGIEIAVTNRKLFLAQKSVTAKCNKVGKPIIVTYRVHFDGDDVKVDTDSITNTVLEGIDAIFLTTGDLNARETAKLILTVDSVCREAESARWQRQIFNELSYKAMIPLDPMHSIAIGAVQTSLKCNAAAIVVTTTTGRSAILISTYRPRCPIMAVTRYGAVSRWLQIYFGIYSYHYRVPSYTDWSRDMESRIQSGIDHLRRKRWIVTGDAIVIVSTCRQSTGFTNCIRVVYASPGRIMCSSVTHCV